MNSYDPVEKQTDRTGETHAASILRNEVDFFNGIRFIINKLHAGRCAGVEKYKVWVAERK